MHKGLGWMGGVQGIGRDLGQGRLVSTFHYLYPKGGRLV